MTLVGVSVVKNEADMIEAMIRHNLGFLDYITVFDNGSTDSTRDIVAQLIAEGLPCQLEAAFGVDHQQDKILTDALPHLARDHDAQYILPLDCDECLKGDPRAFREELRQADGLISLPWVTYVPTAEDPVAELNPLRRITHRRRREVPEYRKVCIPGALADAVTLGKGSHSAAMNGRTLSAEPSASTALAHFPLRSKAQLMSKVLIGAWSVRVRNKTAGRAEEAYQWKALAAEILENGTLPDQTFFDTAVTYAARRPVKIVHDPLATDSVLKYTAPPSPDQLLTNVIQYTETLVGKIETSSL